MNPRIVNGIENASQKNPDANFTLFTLSGHQLSGKIVEIGDSMVTLETGGEISKVPVMQIEAFSYKIQNQVSFPSVRPARI
jgi:hypothetical protein